MIGQISDYFFDELLEIYNSREIDSLLRIVVKEILNLNYAEFIVNKQKIFIDQWSFVIILFKYPKYFVIKMAKQNDYCDPQGLQLWTILVT